MATTNTNQGEWYTTTVGTHEFVLPVRYQNLVPFESGGSGVVMSLFSRATDMETRKPVAINKLIRQLDTVRNASRTYRKFKLLMYLNHPDAQVVQLLNVFTSEKTLEDFQTLYFVFNFVDYDLNRVIRRNVPFSEDHIKLIIYSILRGLKFIHSADVIHYGINPSNIRLNSKTDVTILGFELPRISSDGEYNSYVFARWWHAPEPFVLQKPYTKKLDVWSVGCIMAELILLRPIFRGSDQIDQLNKIFDVLGTPDSATIHEICIPGACAYINGLPRKEKKDFNELFGFKYDPGSETPISGVSPEGIDLLDRLLSFDPRLRLTAEAALAHPFFEGLHDPMDEPTVGPMVDEHEGAEYTTLEWKAIIWEMIEEFQPPSWINDDDLPEDS